MSRTARATIGALFGYARFTVSLIGGLWLVPFSIRHVGTNLYGLWLASGELIAYAGLMELGVLVTLPWLVAQADGRGDRGRMRDLVATGGAAALLAATIIAVISAALWLSMPRLLHLRPADQHALLGPVLIVAIVGAVANPLRVFSCVLEGLQDVRFNGAVQLCQAVVSLGLTFALLRGGYGLYALAVAVTLPQLIGGLWAVLRVRAIAPDLLHGWQRPTWTGIRGLFVEGLGPWIAGWGWRLISASDGLVLAALGRSGGAVAALACTNKLAQAFTQLAWMPCDSGLIGLAQLSGEQKSDRLRDAVIVMTRVYLAMAGAVACVVIAVNPAFVTRWVGINLYAGWEANTLIAVLCVAMTLGHALAVVPSVLGHRLAIGIATLASGVIHVGLALALGYRFGIVGVLMAGVLSHGVVFCALSWRSFARATGLPQHALAVDVLLPWARRVAPVTIVAVVVENLIGTPPLPITIAAGGLIGAVAMWYMRPLYLTFGPVRALYDRVFKSLPLRTPRRDAA